MKFDDVVFYKNTKYILKNIKIYKICKKYKKIYILKTLSTFNKIKILIWKIIKFFWKK